MANKTAVIAATIAATLLTAAAATEITTYAVTNTANPMNLITFEKANALAKKMESSKKDCEALKNALKEKLATGTLKYENGVLTWTLAKKDDAGKPIIKSEEIKNNWTALKEFLASEDAKMKEEMKEEKKEEVKAEEVKAEEVKAEEVKAEEVKTEEVKTEEVKAEEVKAEEVKTEEVKTEEVKTEEVKAADAATPVAPAAK